MANDLVMMCRECGKIKLGDDLWIGEEHPSYNVLSKRLNITDGYCLEHLYKNQLLRKKIYEKIENTLFE